MSKSLRAALFSCVLLIMCISVPSSAQTCGVFSFSSNQVFSACNDLPVLNAFLHWTYHPSNMTADIAFCRTGTSKTDWVASGLNPSGQLMAGTQAIVAFHNSSGSPTAYATQVGASPTMQQGNLTFGVSNIIAEYANNETIIFATLLLDSTLISTNQVWQVATMSGIFFNPHAIDAANRAAVGSISFETGTSVDGSVTISGKNNVNGVLNAVSWEVSKLICICSIIVICI